MIKNTTYYDEHAIRSFNSLTKKGIKVLFITCILLSIAISISFINDDPILAIIIVAVGIICAVLFSLLLLKNINKNIDASIKVNKNAVVQYEFIQDSFSYNSKSDNSEAKGNHFYTDLFKALEIEGYLFLFRTPAEAYIVSFDGFEEKFHIDELKHRLKLANIKIQKM